MPDTDDLAKDPMPAETPAYDLPSFDMDPATAASFGRLEELHRTIDIVEALVTQETALVRAGKIAEVKELQIRKNAAAALYQAQAVQLLADTAFLRGSDNPFRTQLAERTQSLRRLMAENRTVLNAAKASRYHRIEAVMKAMRKQVADDSQYTPDGGLTINRPRRKPVLTRSFNAKI